MTGAAGAHNDHYITRIARVVLQNVKNKDLCLILVRSIDFFGRTIVQTKYPETRADLEQALGALREAYDKCDSETLRFEIEMATAHFSRELYDRLGSPCGPVISKVEYADPARYGRPKEGNLVYQFGFVVLSKGSYTMNIVLHNQVSHKNRVLRVTTFRDPSEYSLRRGGCGGSNSVVLPKWLHILD